MGSHNSLKGQCTVLCLFSSKWTNLGLPERSECAFLTIVLLIEITCPNAFLQDLPQIIIWCWAEEKRSLQNQLFSIQLIDMKLHLRGSGCLNILQSICHRILEI